MIEERKVQEAWISFLLDSLDLNEFWKADILDFWEFFYDYLSEDEKQKVWYVLKSVTCEEQLRTLLLNLLWLEHEVGVEVTALDVGFIERVYYVYLDPGDVLTAEKLKKLYKEEDFLRVEVSKSRNRLVLVFCFVRCGGRDD